MIYDLSSTGPHYYLTPFSLASLVAAGVCLHVLVRSWVTDVLVRRFGTLERVR